MKLGVCTSKRVDAAEKILDLFGLSAYFSFVSGGEIGRHKWQQLQELLANGVITQSAVMVGDRSVDITAAHRNGLQAAGVLWGHGSREELEGERPRYLFASPEELLHLVRDHGN
jgi:phosphoglycolate phosphatase